MDCDYVEMLGKHKKVYNPKNKKEWICAGCGAKGTEEVSQSPSNEYEKLEKRFA